MNNIYLSFILFCAMIAVWVIAAIGSLYFNNNDVLAKRWGYIFSIIGSILGIYSSFLTMVYGQTFSILLNTNLPLSFINISVDRFSAFFIFIISLISFCSSLYALSYTDHYFHKYSIGILGFFYNLFLIGMVLVVSAFNLFYFLIVWEIMSLSSYFLVIYENREKANVKAGLVYFIMTHIGTAFIILSFLLLYKYIGSFDFTIIRQNINSVPSTIRDIVFLLALVGLGTKAGIIPFHIWLPSAHPAAPSHVSALMSGVMIKTGIYMLIRLTVDLMPDFPLWWGIVVLTLGSISSLMGVLYALTEHDIKKLLAYHSIENIGIILLGFGSSLMFWSLNLKTFAVLGMTASLFHTLNHAVFKSLLFMGAGSVISETETRNMEKYGGLIKFMPQTAFLFLIGCMAISALPPLNGFMSEWLTYQALFAGITNQNIIVRWFFIMGTGSLAFTGGLAIMCFVKVFSAVFLARPRNDNILKAKESKPALLLGMGTLALLTLLIGLFSAPIYSLITSISESLNLYNKTVFVHSPANLTLTVNYGYSSITMPLILAVMISVCLFIYLSVLLITRNNKEISGETWDCGTTLEPGMEITPGGFARSIIIIFKNILRPTKDTNIEYLDTNYRYFIKSNTVELGLKDVYRTYFYHPVHKLISKSAEFSKIIQNGNLNVYVLYILIVFIILMFLVNK